jgi:hypothetical protein
MLKITEAKRIENGKQIEGLGLKVHSKGLDFLGLAEPGILGPCPIRPNYSKVKDSGKLVKS